MKPNFERIAPFLTVQSETQCWEWNGTRLSDGYGVITVYIRGSWDKVKLHGRYDAYLVHRLMYELFKEPIPKHLVVNHLCENKPCCNPLHLEVCTRGENILYSDGLARRNAEKTHCKRGHLLAGENLLPVPKGRDCRTCQRRRVREYQARRRALKKAA